MQTLNVDELTELSGWLHPTWENILKVRVPNKRETRLPFF